MKVPYLVKVLVVALFSWSDGYAQEIPQAVISNGLITAKLYLPDSSHGYYRATRFDWSGVMPSLEHDGHQYSLFGTRWTSIFWKMV
jgi:hypothetical protein